MGGALRDEASGSMRMPSRRCIRTESSERAGAPDDHTRWDVVELTGSILSFGNASLGIETGAAALGRASGKAQTTGLDQTSSERR